MSSLSAFTNQLLNLSKNLCELYPEDPDLEFTKNSIQFMKKSNPRKIQHLFDTYIAKYKQQILNKEADFFLYRDIVKDDLNLDNKTVDYAQTIMYNLKKYWSDIDDESKENIWKYLQVLIILNDKC